MTFLLIQHNTSYTEDHDVESNAPLLLCLNWSLNTAQEYHATQPAGEQALFVLHKGTISTGDTCGTAQCHVLIGYNSFMVHLPYIIQ